ncbi:hypothetical protein EVAR_10637_1 [Eumeta japonica]|uniref:Uncharacterized protein n=1 Tax=Eumeta variegata TaxID=151549 RepID=A0A4C1U776_EUMVA|nr:hypothetical protein EVAR_10637_1 [Eumeta japonica]
MNTIEYKYDASPMLASSQKHLETTSRPPSAVPKSGTNSYIRVLSIHKSALVKTQLARARAGRKGAFYLQVATKLAHGGRSVTSAAQFS